MQLVITSPAFPPDGPIPEQYTCEGADLSPPLEWQGAPAGTKSYALIVDDPDAPDPRAPQLTYVHWVVVDLPAESAGLAEDAARTGMPAGAREGLNDWGRATWGGPCPPIGRHRYFFKLYALDALLPALKAPRKAELESAMAGHVLASAELIGTYEKRSG